MILIDFSQISYACTIEFLVMSKTAKAELDLVRHMILNTIRSNVRRSKGAYGEVVVAFDSNSYWRKEQFPHYKASRKKARDNSQFDWKSIFTCIDTLKDEFRTYLPYKIIDVPGAEADDVIGCLTLSQPMGVPVLILSGDKDFVQLQGCHARVEQRSPFIKNPIVDLTPHLTLKQHIIRGDSGDGIPNILSPDDVFVSGGRQKPIRETKVIQWLQQKPEEFCATPEILKNYRRNEQLIDLTFIPAHISVSIRAQYETIKPATRLEFFNYLVASGLKELTASAADF